MAAIKFLEPASRRGAPLPDTAVRVLGIDLGTTNSTVADLAFDPDEREIGRPRPLAIEQHCPGETIRGPLVPSVVAIVNDQPLVGHAAARFRQSPGAFGLEKDVSLFHETKNEIGLNKVFFRAPDGYRNPADIAGHVLRMLHDEATDAEPADRVVVTVPASFQTSQRAETVHAAALAGIDLAPGDLLDEPVAVFTDKYVSAGGQPFVSRGPGTMLVFDFGGGTCDVAVLRVDAHDGERPEISPLAVSRYHRLGGGDIDRAIIHEALIPQIVEQNGLGKFELGFAIKDEAIVPALLTIAESLKIELCRNPGADVATIERTVKIRHEDRELRLRNPSLATDMFIEILAPFLDRDLPFESGLEYRTQMSVFVPIEDALDRAGLGMDEIDYVLLAGGSSLIPWLVIAIGEAFPGANIVSYKDDDAVQTAVARGAAYQAMSLALYGEGVVRPVTHESISLRTSDGLVEIVPKGADLPYPSDVAWKRLDVLAVPETCEDGVLELRIEVVAGRDQSPLDSRVWELPAPVEAGDRLWVDVCFDENQVLQLNLSSDRPGAEPYTMRIENPVTHVVNPGEVRLRIAKTERELDAGDVPPEKVVDKLTDLGNDYAEIGHRERALDRLKRGLKRLGRPNTYILNTMGIIAGDMGDRASQEKYYLQAAAADPGYSSSLFNLALAKLNADEYEEAMQHVEAAIARSASAPYYVLKAKIASALGDRARSSAALDRAMAEFAPVPLLSGFELGWYESAARLRDDEDGVERAKAERRGRLRAKPVERVDRGVLPRSRTQSRS